MAALKIQGWKDWQLKAMLRVFFRCPWWGTFFPLLLPSSSSQVNVTASKGRVCLPFQQLEELTCFPREAAQEYWVLDNMEPRNEEQVEITSLMLNDVELTHGKADCGLCLGHRCSRKAKIAWKIPLLWRLWVKGGKRWDYLGELSMRLERNHRMTGVDPTANLSAGWENVIYFSYWVS